MNESKFASLVENSKKILIASHINPDGDALGSSLALWKMFRSFGKEPVIYSRDPVPGNLKFLPGTDEITDKLNGVFDLTIILDCSSPKRVSDEFLSFDGKGRLIIIDHHVGDGENFNEDLVIRDERSAAVGEIVYSLIKKLGWKVDADIAQYLYCAIVTDTSFFRYSNVTPELFEKAGELVRFGASPAQVARYLEEEYPFERFKLLGLALNSMDLELDGKFCMMEVGQKMLNSTGADVSLSEEFANIPRSVKGVTVSALLRERDDGDVRISLRSKGDIDVSKLASKFGGGGHRNAAGCTIKAKVKDVKKSLKSEVKMLI